MVVGCQPYAPAAFTRSKYYWYSFLFEMSMKNPLTLAGIEPANFRFVAQHLNHCATAGYTRIFRINYVNGYEHRDFIWKWNSVNEIAVMINLHMLMWYPCSRLKHKLCFSLLHGYHHNPATPKLQHTSKQEHTTNVVIQYKSRRLLMMDVLMSETC